MSETTHLNLPLLAAAQAQKHVTMNEALTRLDAAIQLGVQSRSLASPPALVVGATYLVADAATDEWSGKDGLLAFAVAGGWDFLSPLPGWSIWVADETISLTYDGVNWHSNALAISPFGASFGASVLEFDEMITAAGTSFGTTGFIPANTSVLAVTGRVISGFDGGLTDFSLGVLGSDNRYGSGLSGVTDAWLRGLTGQPQSYYADTPFLLTANGGNFGNGHLRLSVHLFTFGVPGIA